MHTHRIPNMITIRQLGDAAFVKPSPEDSRGLFGLFRRPDQDRVLDILGDVLGGCTAK